MPRQLFQCLHLMIIHAALTQVGNFVNESKVLRSLLHFACRTHVAKRILTTGMRISVFFALISTLETSWNIRPPICTEWIFVRKTHVLQQRHRKCVSLNEKRWTQSFRLITNAGWFQMRSYEHCCYVVSVPACHEGIVEWDNQLIVKLIVTLFNSLLSAGNYKESN